MNPKKIYMNLKIKYKILIGMLAVTIMVLGPVSYIAYNYFYDFSVHQASLEIDKSLEVTKESMLESIMKLHRNIAAFLAHTEVQQALLDIQKPAPENTMNHYLATQEFFNFTIQSHSLIDSMYLLGKNDEFYSTFTVGLGHKLDSHFLFDETTQIKGHQWLETSLDPFHPREHHVIPLVFPIDQDYLSTFNYLVNDPDSIYANLYLFIDVNQLRLFLNQMNKNADSTILLYNGSQPTTAIPSDDLYELYHSSSVEDFMASPSSSSIIDYGDDTYRISKESLGIQNLWVVNFISRTQLLEPLAPLKTAFLATLFVGILMSIALSLIMAQSITSPLRKLMVVVSEIGNGNFRESNKYVYNDEVGKLRGKLNTMSTTINRQISIIKKQEQDYAKAEIDILTQQINPHFLYNTLDCIRWEILSGNTEGSSAMVESLGQFLRLGLNRSSRTIAVEKEIERIKEYIQIINQRQTTSIELETSVAEGLLNYPIISLILQPLIENAMKHGFSEEALEIIQDPHIRLDFQVVDDMMQIVIEDNGIGMAIAKMDQILEEALPDTPHVGIKNVYLRLKTYYGNEASMVFDSTPFYSNTVTLQFPLKDHLTT